MLIGESCLVTTIPSTQACDLFSATEALHQLFDQFFRVCWYRSIRIERTKEKSSVSWSINSWLLQRKYVKKRTNWRDKYIDWSQSQSIAYMQITIRIIISSSCVFSPYFWEQQVVWVEHWWMQSNEIQEETSAVRIHQRKPLWIWLDLRFNKVWILVRDGLYREEEKRNIKVLVKYGDDLRQDQVVLQIFRVFEKIWKDNNIDVIMTIYNCTITWMDLIH